MPTQTPIALTLLPVGKTARLHNTQLDAQSSGLLRALGLCEAECLTVCKAGEPCILQVGATRIGVSRTVASKIYVIPDGPVPARQ